MTHTEAEQHAPNEKDRMVSQSLALLLQTKR